MCKVNGSTISMLYRHTPYFAVKCRMVEFVTSLAKALILTTLAMVWQAIQLLSISLTLQTYTLKQITL